MPMDRGVSWEDAGDMAIHRRVAPIAAIVCTCWAQIASAQAPATPVTPPFELRGQDLLVNGTGSVTVVALGCEGTAILQHETRVFVTCAREEVVVVDVSDATQPRIAERRRVDGDHAEVFLLDGKPWVRTVREEARPFDALQKSGSPAMSPPTPPLPTVAPVPPPAPIVALPPIKEVSLMQPPRVGGITEVELGALAFVNFGDIGGGGMLDASIVHRFVVPAFVGAYVRPIGVAGTKGTSGGPTGVFSGAAVVGIDSQWIEVGLGAGTATNAVGVLGFQLMTRGRIGPRDGVHFRWVTGILADKDRFELGVLAFGMQIPMLRNWALEIDGEGGLERSGRGLVGVRFRAAGDGGPGTFEITGSAGFAIVTSNATCTQAGPPNYATTCSGTSATYFGPALAGGLAWRL
jgi:hypothetical protein